jgi:glyoxalase-like protein
MTESTRRDWLRFCAAAGASGFFVSPLRSAEHSTSAVTAVDHLLLGVSDLDRGIAWVEKKTGVRAAVGGSHPGVGTRNALLSLGGRRYLEIIAPDPAQSAFTFRIDLRKLSEPRLITWAAATGDVNALSKKAREAGLAVQGPEPGSRERPDGKVLRWKTLGIQVELEADGVDPIPFFIEWASDSVHPSQDSPRGCELLAFEVAHPRRSEVRGVLEKLGIDAIVKSGQPALLQASLKTPGGAARLA